MANAISAYSTLAIAVLTLIYVGVSWFTLRKIGRQVESAEKAADAAKLTAEAVINAERAWMIMCLGTGEPMEIAGTLRFRGDMRNVGETPAIIIGAQHDFKMLEEGECLPDRPPYLDKSSEPMNDPLAPKTGGTPIYWTVGKGTRDQIIMELVTFYVFGQIVYRDVFGQARETRYCFRYYAKKQNSADLHLGFFSEGPPEYQKIT